MAFSWRRSVMMFAGKVIAISLLSLTLIDQAQAMTFETRGTGGNCDGCEWISAEGEITAETPDQFESFVKQQDRKDGLHIKRQVYFNSPGGSLAAGIKLGELIRKYQYQTAVGATVPDDAGWYRVSGGTCASACSFAFIGGEVRIADGGEIGVHQFYNDVALSDPSAKIFNALDLSAQQFVSALLIEYVFRMGVDPRFVSVASTTPPTEVRFLTAKEADELKVSWDPHKFDPWVLEPYGTGAVTYSQSRDKALTATIFCRQDRTPRLLLTDRFSFQGLPRMRSAVAALNGINIFGLALPKEDVVARQVGDAVGYEVTLRGFDPRRLADAKGLSISGETSHADRSFFDYYLPSENAVKTIAVALRNCL